MQPKKGRIEKWVLRKAFDDEENPYLPKVHIEVSQNVSIGVKNRPLLNVARLTVVSRGLGFWVNESNEVGLFWESLQHILYRQKEQFSDGVGYSWIDGLKDHAASHVFFLPTLVLSGLMLQRWIDDLAV